MRPNALRPIHPIANARGGAAGVVVALLLVLALAGGAGYWAYGTYYKQAPPRTKLAAVKVKEEVVQFVHDRVSRALHHNLVMLDDIVVMMDQERKRLQRLGKKFPDQETIIASQQAELTASRDRLAGVLKEVTARVEKIYVTWLVNRAEGTGLIQSQKGTLTRRLADAIRGEAVLIGRIRNNPAATS
ncbi:MAG TPA: hypothetical protein VLT88_10295 [Desulfosarcina sp.]|nr:hypothetical protein [Desulfosarcina sp.]